MRKYQFFIGRDGGEHVAREMFVANVFRHERFKMFSLRPVFRRVMPEPDTALCFGTRYRIDDFDRSILNLPPSLFLLCYHDNKQRGFVRSRDYYNNHFYEHLITMEMVYELADSTFEKKNVRFVNNVQVRVKRQVLFHRFPQK